MNCKSPDKYYWLVFSHNNAGGGKTNIECVTWKHPFQYMKEYETDTDGSGVIVNLTLLNYKEISKQEYLMFNKLWA